jgi:hypothetical protein
MRDRCRSEMVTRGVPVADRVPGRVAGHAWASVSDRYEGQRRVQVMEIVGVAGRDGLPGSPRAHDHVGVDYIRRPGCCEEASDARGVHAAQSHNIRCRLADQTCEAGLAGWVAHGLRERRRRDGDACGGFKSAGEQRNDAAVVAVESDESAGVEGHPAGHAAPVRCP